MQTLFFTESLSLFNLIVSIALLNYKKKEIVVICFVSLLFLMYFYRYPCRNNLISKENSIVSPCDGTILAIQQTNDFYHIKVFLSIFDVHVQWYPVDGRIVKTQYKPGEFNIAYILEKSDYNEKMTTVIQHTKGLIRVDQIAGQVATRIVNHSIQDTHIKRGDYMGMIKLSSRVDIFLPVSSVKLLCNVKDKVRGNETILAEWI